MAECGKKEIEQTAPAPEDAKAPSAGPWKKYKWEIMGEDEEIEMWLPKVAYEYLEDLIDQTPTGKKRKARFNRDGRDGRLSTTGRRYGTTPYHLPLWRISVTLPSACSTLLCSFPLPCGYLP